MKTIKNTLKYSALCFVILACCCFYGYSQDAEQQRYWMTDTQLQHLKQIYINLNQNNQTLQEQLQNSMKKSLNLETTSRTLQEQLEQSLIRQQNSEQKSETLQEQLEGQSQTLESLNSSYETLNSRYYELIEEKENLNLETIELGTRMKAWRTAAIVAITIAVAMLVLFIIKLKR